MASEDNKVIQVEGDPDSPISRGRLCPKGSASEQLINSATRLTKIKYRAPYSLALPTSLRARHRRGWQQDPVFWAHDRAQQVRHDKADEPNESSEEPETDCAVATGRSTARERVAAPAAATRVLRRMRVNVRPKTFSGATMPLATK